MRPACRLAPSQPPLTAKLATALRFRLLPLFSAIAGIGCSCDHDPDDPRQLAATLADSTAPRMAIHRVLGAHEAALRRGDLRRDSKIRAAALPALERLYHSGRAQDDVLDAMGKLRDPAAVPFLLRALDPELGRPAGAAAALAETGDRRAVGPLLHLLGRLRTRPSLDPEFAIQRAVVEALGRLGDLRATPILCDVLLSPAAGHDYFVSRLAAVALGEIGDQAAVPALIEGLFHAGPGTSIYDECRLALVRIGRPALEPLLRVLERLEPRVEERVARSPEPLPPWVVTERVAGVLGALGFPAAAPPLHAWLARHATWPGDVPGRAAVAEALAQLGDPSATPALVTLLSDAGSLSERARVADTLGFLGDQRALPALLAAARQRSERTGSAAGGGAAADDGLATMRQRAALAYARLAGAGDGAAFDLLLAEEADEERRGNLRAYRVRLDLSEECGERVACYRQQLGHADWRVQEKAALMLARLAAGDPERAAIADQLAQRYPARQLDLRRAILVALDRLADARCRPCTTVLPELAAQETAHSAYRLVSNQVLCLAARVARRGSPAATHGPAAGQAGSAETGTAQLGGGTAGALGAVQLGGGTAGAADSQGERR